LAELKALVFPKRIGRYYHKFVTKSPFLAIPAHKVVDTLSGHSSGFAPDPAAGRERGRGSFDRRGAHTIIRRQAGVRSSGAISVNMMFFFK